MAIRDLVQSAALVAVICTLAASPSAPAKVTVPMQAQNGSGETGMATLTQEKSGVEVAVKIAGAPSGVEQPMHIHAGTCAHLNPAPKYPLTSAAGGTSTTLVKGVTLAELLASPFAINIHKSTADLKTYVSCGEIRVAGKSNSM